MIYIYFNDKNGTIYSADKQRCFSVVFGDDVYAFLRSEKNKEKRFYRTQTEETGGDMVLIEVPPEKVRAVRKEERRKQYVSDCMKNKEFTILHLGNMDSDDGITGEELIASLDESVDTLAIRNLDLKHSLADSSLPICYALFSPRRAHRFRCALLLILPIVALSLT